MQPLAGLPCYRFASVIMCAALVVLILMESSPYPGAILVLLKDLLVARWFGVNDHTWLYCPIPVTALLTMTPL